MIRLNDEPISEVTLPTQVTPTPQQPHHPQQPIMEHTIKANGSTITQKQYPSLNGKTWIVVIVCLVCQLVFAIAFLTAIVLDYAMDWNISDLAMGFMWSFAVLFFSVGISLVFSLISKKPKLVSFGDFRNRK